MYESDLRKKYEQELKQNLLQMINQNIKQPYNLEKALQFEIKTMSQHFKLD